MNFQGSLKFVDFLTFNEIIQIKKLFNPNYTQNYFRLFCFTEKQDGIEWNGVSCDPYQLIQEINSFIEIMKKDNPKFDLIGSLCYKDTSSNTNFIINKDLNEFSFLLQKEV